MGVLDDAIREHLELKLQRGADAGEVEKQAAEALGPARREPPAQPAVEPDEPGAEAAEVPEVVNEPVVDVPAAEPPTQLAEGLAPPAVPAEPEPQPAPETESGFELAPPPEPEPQEPAPSAEVTPLHPVDDVPAVEEPAEPDEVPADEQIDDPPPPERGSGSEPLWFEQKPRRDFDLDD